MTFNNHLYYEKRFTKVTYTDNPESGDLDVNRLLCKESPFRDEASWTVLKPKTILLSGLDLSSWPAYQIAAFKYRLTLLEEAGFEIYDGIGRKLSRDYCGILEFDLQVIKAVTKLDVPADELIVFDLDFATQFVLGDEGDYEDLIGRSEINFTVPLSFESFKKLLTSNAECIISLDLSCCYNLQGEDNYLDDLPKLPYLEALTLDLKRYPSIYGSQALRKLLNKICKLSPNLSQLTLPYYEPLTYVNPSNITHLTIAEAKIPTGYLNDMTELKKLCLPAESSLTLDTINRFTQLEELTIASVETEESFTFLLGKNFKKLDIFGIDLTQLENLEILKASYDLMNIGVLNCLLSQTSNLKQITIVRCNKMSGELAENICLPGLEGIAIDKSLNWSSFKRLLFQNPSHLKRLSVTSEINFVSKDLRDLRLPALESLALTGKITGDSLYYLLRAGSNIKVLNLSQVRIIEPYTMPEDVELSALEELDLSSASIPSQVLNIILSQAKRLKTLKLYELHIYGQISPVALLNLEILDARQFHYQNVLNAILPGAVNLKKLNITHTFIQENSIDPAHLALAKLEELDLTCCTVGHHLLHGFLKSTQCLRVLELTNATVNGTALDGSSLRDVDLTYLEVFEVPEEGLSGAEVNQCLMQTKKLKRISIAPHKEGDIDLSQIKDATQLEILSVNSRCDIEQLSMLLLRAKALKSMLYPTPMNFRFSQISNTSFPPALSYRRSQIYQAGIYN